MVNEKLQAKAHFLQICSRKNYFPAIRLISRQPSKALAIRLISRQPSKALAIRLISRQPSKALAIRLNFPAAFQSLGYPLNFPAAFQSLGYPPDFPAIPSKVPGYPLKFHDYLPKSPVIHPNFPAIPLNSRLFSKISAELSPLHVNS
jgi:hypothetical protein